MLSTSEYLKVQADLLIAVDGLRRLPLREFIAMAIERGEDIPLYDHDQLPVAIAPGLVEVARGALAMVEAGPHARARKQCASQAAAADAMRRAG